MLLFEISTTKLSIWFSSSNLKVNLHSFSIQPSSFFYVLSILSRTMNNYWIYTGVGWMLSEFREMFIFNFIVNLLYDAKAKCMPISNFNDLGRPFMFNLIRLPFIFQKPRNCTFCWYQILKRGIRKFVWPSYIGSRTQEGRYRFIKTTDILYTPSLPTPSFPPPSALFDFMHWIFNTFLPTQIFWFQKLLLENNLIDWYFAVSYIKLKYFVKQYLWLCVCMEFLSEYLW